MKTNHILRSRIYPCLWISCVLSLTVLRVLGQTKPTDQKPTKELDIYLLIGGTNMAGRAKIPEDAQAVIEHCFLLNEKNQWVPASSPLNRYSSIAKGDDLTKFGPGVGFARAMTEHDKSASIGLVSNAGSGLKIDEWWEKSKAYRGIRGRSKAAQANGKIKGVIWLHGEETPEDPVAYSETLRSMISNLRMDLGELDLPFIVGQFPGKAELNAQLTKMSESLHASAVAVADGLTVSKDGQLDAKSQLLLGKRFAERMTEVQAGIAGAAPKPPADMKFIDPHVHAMSVTPGGLAAVAKWMDARNIERCIVSPLDHKGSRPKSEEEYQTMLANFRPFKGKIDRMCLIEPGEFKTVDEAVTFLKREIADGAIAMGEHYGKELMFDDPKNLLIYEACEKTGLPVMFHIDQGKNMVEPGMERVDHVLKKFPNCKVVAHAYWWRQLANGSCDRQLQEHPNLYADMSGTVVINQLNRDRKYAREFIIRNQDKLLWATDEGWWSFGDPAKQMNDHYTFFEGLDLPDEVRRKIYRENSIKVYGLK